MYAACEYKVIGKVQGVFFRKHTFEKAQSLNLVGWVMNAKDGSVVGAAQGEKKALSEFRTWISIQGSPKSVIESCTFTNDKEVESLEFTSFEIAHEKKSRSSKAPKESKSSTTNKEKTPKKKKKTKTTPKEEKRTEGA